MKTFTGLAVLVFASYTARAEAVDLSCSGVTHTYRPKHIEMEVAPAAANVDLQEHKISTPVGTFHITTVSETEVSFDQPTNRRYVVDGTLDRVSGLMKVFWHLPNEANQMTMYSELNCSIAKRLF
jgi:hypothetical protein